MNTLIPEREIKAWMGWMYLGWPPVATTSLLEKGEWVRLKWSRIEPLYTQEQVEKLLKEKK